MMSGRVKRQILGNVQIGQGGWETKLSIKHHLLLKCLRLPSKCKNTSTKGNNLTMKVFLATLAQNGKEHCRA